MLNQSPTLSEATRATRRETHKARTMSREAVRELMTRREQAAFRASKERVLEQWAAKELRTVNGTIPAGIYGKVSL